MGKGKLAKFADMERYENVFQYPYGVVSDVPFEMKGHWRQQYFHNDNPIVLELGCGKGEYAVELARMYPDVNFIGVDIKGARMWTGATQAIEAGLKNVAFLRTNIEIIDRFFGEDEVQEIWLTFSDPQMKNPRKRLSSTYFLERYRKFLVDGGVIHLKSDSNFLFTYTSYVVDTNKLPLLFRTTDLYSLVDEEGNVKTSAAGEDGATSESSPSAPLSSPRGDQEGAPVHDADVRHATAIQTYYEKMWMERGIPIKYQKFSLPRTAQLVEPEVEIELDEYRSYHREKRSPKEKAV